MVLHSDYMPSKAVQLRLSRIWRFSGFIKIWITYNSFPYAFRGLGSMKDLLNVTEARSIGLVWRARAKNLGRF
jgi:hypothetical protein